uniref:NADH-ubiquinone oxidoreductase chain 4 n=1 Tax=Perumytilus purpuratus TaxID=390823 RepID=A0A346KKZ0_PERPP|nr:NADH dehydrogenase subunit 4 [Perumytilus purpuratus]AXP84508.1 NADH dehydrogenase subunit 4 [Perumytilus purpuratus]
MVLGLIMNVVFFMCFLDSASLLIGLMILFFFSLLFMGCGCNTQELVGIVSCDFVACSMVCLSLYVVSLMMMMGLGVKRENLLMLMNLVMVGALILAFCVSNFFLFFFFFESCLIPVMLMILFWGYQPERLQAVSYMVIYTSAGAFPFLFGISSLVYSGMSDAMNSLTNCFNKEVCFFYWFFLMGFFVKLPMFPFHLWLPKAHVEAPVFGSMILAGVLLKLGGYGLIRFLCVSVVPMESFSFCLLLSASLFGGFLTSMISMVQVDLKSLIAYSSVGHMSLVMFGIMSNSLVGFYGAVVLMIGHGLCSSGLFSLIWIFYNVSGSRSVVLNKGFLKLFPALVLACFVLSIGNMSAPPTASFLGEILLLMSCAATSWWFLFVFGLISFVGAVYSLYLYGCCCHGKSSEMVSMKNVIVFKDLLVLLLHCLPLNLLFVVF